MSLRRTFFLRLLGATPRKARRASLGVCTTRLGLGLGLWACCLGLLLQGALHMAAPLPARADNWQASIYDAALPSRLVAVDKASQTFHLLEKKSPLHLKYSFPCTTGQAVGDKQIVNDLRTPEGVYFVEYKIASGLDFKEYGGIAYTLNYPNPVDKLRGKTGHGIWIHSKGFGIVPRDTKGCVAIGLQEIAEVGPLLTPGTAVMLAEKVPTQAQPRRDPGTARALSQKMEQWTRAWATRSSRMFEMYDEQAYSKAMPESFAAFKANKQRLFKMLPWINIFNREVHALEGPGYWVTWSEQFYRAPNLSTEGVRRLYWQPGSDGKYRIVGMEWTPRNLGMQADYLKGRLVAASNAPHSDAASEVPLPPPLNMPENADGERAGLAPAPQILPGQPLQSPAQNPALSPAQNMAQNMAQNTAQNTAASLAAPADPQPVQLAAASPPAPQVPPALSVPQAPQEPPAPSAPQAPPLELNPATTALLVNKMQQWSQAWQARSPQFFDFYDPAAYGTPEKPAGRAQRPGRSQRTDSFRALKTDMERRFRTSAWIHMVNRPVSVLLDGNTPRAAITTCAQFIRLPGQAAVQGTRSLTWQQGPDGQFRIVQSTWTAEALGMEADYLELVTAQVEHLITQWRQEWLAGRVEAYGEFYSARAKQQGRVGKQAILSHKSRVWAKAAPALVQLSGLRVQTDPRGLRADMTQVYRDSNKYEDRGTKTLILEPSGNGWTIVEEDWAALPPASAATSAPDLAEPSAPPSGQAGAPTTAGAPKARGVVSPAAKLAKSPSGGTPVRGR